ncbi:MAG: hypothetical protein OXI61_16045 [Candidatus Poribacteria bacterium]|nr:hypothetical protein [Candidatus Poribacteria bacterium]
MKNKIGDIAVILGKTALGSIPAVGPLVAEIIGNLIPDLRFKRIFSLLEALEAKIDPEEKEKIEAKMLEEKSIDLMEDGFLQAARALSEERIDYIASLLKNGLTDEDLEHIAYKKLLSILGEINDIEVLILKSHSMTLIKAQEFRTTHNNILNRPIVSLYAPQDELDKATIYETYEINLARLDLIERRFKKPLQGESPKFDEKTGMMEAQGYSITSLGMLLLRSIDQDEDAYWKQH